jgi:hypothetical protein
LLIFEQEAQNSTGRPFRSIAFRANAIKKITTNYSITLMKINTIPFASQLAQGLLKSIKLQLVIR